MKKKTILIVGIIIAVLLIGVIAGLVYHRSTYGTVGGVQYPLNTTSMKATVTTDADVETLTKFTQLQQLDLRASSLTPQQYDTLKAALPQCSIVWNVPLHSGSVSSDTAKLKLTALSDADIPLLAYFPELVKVDARGCTDYDQLLALSTAYPQLDVYYTLSLDGQFWPNSTTALTLGDVTPEELENAMKYLPNVTSVKLNVMPEDPETIYQIQVKYPNAEFFYQIEVCGVITDTAVTELDLSNIPMESTEALESMLKFMPNLTKVDMCGCGISNEEMEALNNRHEDTLFVWIVYIGPYPVRSDITYFIPVKDEWRVGQEDCQNLRYCTEMVALDLGHMPIFTCEFVAYMPHLKYLIMADTALQNVEPLAELEELVFLEIFLTYVTDYSPLLSVTSLEDLNISHTRGTMEPLTQMTWLKRLWWGANPGDQLEGEELEYLRSCLPNTKVVTNMVYSTGRGWRTGGHYYDMRDYFGMWYMDQNLTE